jgi:hypothetical protein
MGCHRERLTLVLGNFGWNGCKNHSQDCLQQLENVLKVENLPKYFPVFLIKLSDHKFSDLFLVKIARIKVGPMTVSRNKIKPGCHLYKYERIYVLAEHLEKNPKFYASITNALASAKIKSVKMWIQIAMPSELNQNK